MFVPKLDMRGLWLGVHHDVEMGVGADWISEEYQFSDINNSFSPISSDFFPFFLFMSDDSLRPSSYDEYFV